MLVFQIVNIHTVQLGLFITDTNNCPWGGFSALDPQNRLFTYSYSKVHKTSVFIRNLHYKVLSNMLTQDKCSSEFVKGKDNGEQT